MTFEQEAAQFKTCPACGRSKIPQGYIGTIAGCICYRTVLLTPPVGPAPEPRLGEVSVQLGMLTLHLNDRVTVSGEPYRVVRKTHGWAYLAPEIAMPEDPADAYHTPDRTMEGQP